MTDPMTTITPDSIFVSGITSEPGLNGEYVLNGTFRGDKPQWMKPMSRCYIRFIRDRWELYVSHHPSGTTYFYHTANQTIELPPTSGYTPAPCSGADEVLSLEYKYKTPPTSEYLLYTNKACPFAQQVGIVLHELENDESVISETTNSLKLVEPKIIDIFSKNDVDFINSYYKAYPSKLQRPSIPLLAGALPENQHVVVAESSLIIDYLMDHEQLESRHGGGQEDKASHQLRATSAFSKTQVGILVHAVQKEVHPCINYILNASNLERLETAVDKLMDALGCIETMLKRRTMIAHDKFFLGSKHFSLAEAKTAPTFQRLLLVVPELRPELAFVKSLRHFDNKNSKDAAAASSDSTTILLRMIEMMFPTLSQWLSSVFQHPSVVTTFHKEDVVQVLKRARVNKFDMPDAQSDDEPAAAFESTKSKMEGLLLSRKSMPSGP